MIVGLRPLSAAPADIQTIPAFYPHEFTFNLANVPNPFGGPSTLAGLNLSETKNDNVQTPGIAVNPFLSFRMSAWVTPPGGGQPMLLPGFYAGDGTSGSTVSGSLGDIGAGASWKVRFTPDHRPGYWNFVFLLEYDHLAAGPINVADTPVPASPWVNGTSGALVPGVLWAATGTVKSAAVNPNAVGHHGRGFLRSESRTAGTSRYLKYSWPSLAVAKQYFIKIGVNSPENWFGCMDFYKSGKDPRWIMDPQATSGFGSFNTDGPGSGIWHSYSKAPVGQSHGSVLHSSQTDWQNGPKWNTTRSTVIWNGQQLVDMESDALDAGKGIIGAVRYLASSGMNSMYVEPMNLAGDGRDTHPFASINPIDLAFNATGPADARSVFNYSIRRAFEWNTVIGFAMSMGVLVQFQLHEHELANLAWLDFDWNPSTGAAVPGAVHGLTHARRLYLKQMVAHFGCHTGIQWNLCEENALGSGGQFSIPQLRAMADWIMLWDGYHDHPIAVHSNGNDRSLYTAIIAELNNNPPTATAFAPWRNVPWLDVTSYYIYDDAPQVLGSDAASGAQVGIPNTPRPGFEFNFESETAGLRADLDQLGAYGQRVVVAVDEPGEWKFGAAGTNSETMWQLTEKAPTLMSSPDGKRRGALYDILFSGAGGLEWYFGYGMEADGFDRVNFTRDPAEDFGGGDVSADEFRSREELWRASKAARQIMARVAYWTASPADSVVTGEVDDASGGNNHGTGQYGQAQVYGMTTGSPMVTAGFYLIYYPNAYDAQGTPRALGQLQVPGPVSTTASGVAQFYSPITGDEINPQVQMFFDDVTIPLQLGAPPASSWPAPGHRQDLVCIVTIF